MHPKTMTAVLTLVGTLGPSGALSAATSEPAASTEEGLQLRSRSRSPYVHRLTLYDRDGEVIDPTDENARPYSPHATCGKCHAIASIQAGWHFNADRPEVDPGRPGEPWILTDPQSGTQLPISARGWPGTYAPDDAGLSNWQFALTFGRHAPGGGLANPDQNTIDGSPEALRWGISGSLEIDCMVCHSADAQHDPAETARQIEKQNFSWAPTAALGLAVIRGEARKVPDDWDPLAPPDPDFPEQEAPRGMFHMTRFDADDRVLFDATCRPPVDRCYFCHSVREVGPGSPQRWEAENDVHLAAGMICTDCHRNDIEHMITRGFEASAAMLTCEGCHLGVGDSLDPTAALGGRYGAPRPQHRGLPPVHLDKLTCTACHSGPWPGPFPRRVQTALAHGLGLATKERRDDDLPHIVEPIFAAQSDGTIAPHRMIWPAFWGLLRHDAITPVPLETVRRAAGTVVPQADDPVPPHTPLTREQIALILEELSTSRESEGEPVYVRDGYVYRRAGQGAPATASRSVGQIESMQHPAAGPYLWPLGHDVRPAAQSLGVRGCTDCHARNAPFHFGRITLENDTAQRPIEFMYELQGMDPALIRVWASSFTYRPVFKWGGWVCAVLLGAVLVWYGFSSLDRLLRRFR